MKIHSLTTILALLCFSTLKAQQTGNFTVGGDIDKYYPVSFEDGNWSNNKPTELFIGRANVHTNSSWQGSVTAKFTYHVTNWGNGSDFIDASIYDFSLSTTAAMIGGWKDVTTTNSNSKILIWLRGGGSTYYYSANTTVNPAVFDGTQNALPYQQTNGPTFGLKTTKDTYVLSSGFNSKAARLEWLAVYGDIKALKVKVSLSEWPDYVFDNDYTLPTLAEVEQFIERNKHLPGVPSADEVKKDGLDLGNNQKVLLHKIEELTLYVIQLQKEIDVLKSKMK